jgi:uncharacterized protein YjaZ
MRKAKKAFLILLGFILIAGCKNSVPDFERTRLKINGQEFEILTAYGLIENYLKDQNSFADYSRASNRLLFEPVEKEILPGAEASFMFNSIKIPYEPTDNLRTQIELLRTGNITGLLEKALHSITESLPGPGTKIIILPVSSFMKPLLNKYNLPGYGVTIGSGKIIIAIDPTAQDWKGFLTYAVAHEYHHSTWISRNWVSSDFSLLEYLVFEGRADAFAKSINNSVEIPAEMYLTKIQEVHVWNLIKPGLLLKGHERINNVMIGKDDIPFGSGYAIGYHIVRSFRQKNPSCSDFEMIDMNPVKLLESSGYPQ